MSDVDDRLVADIRAVAEPVIESEGADLVDIEVKGHTGSRVVRLFVDADDGVDVELCARLSRTIGTRLDEADPIPGRYTLQVSSPGADRPLRTQRDFARNVGRNVRIDRSGDAGTLEGTITAVGADSISLDVDGEEIEVDLDAVTGGRVLLPW